MTNARGGNEEVVVMHLLPMNLPQTVMNYWVGVFGIDGVHDLRNTVPCSRGIKNLFDHGQACIVPCDDETGLATFRILCNHAKDEKLFEGSSTKIGDFDGRQFVLQSGGNMPMRQILAFHAKQAYLQARSNGWIPYDTQIPKGLVSNVSPLKNDMLHCNMADFESHNDSVVIHWCPSSSIKDIGRLTPAMTKHALD